jgi:hypothetical protein
LVLAPEDSKAGRTGDNKGHDAVREAKRADFFHHRHHRLAQRALTKWMPSSARACASRPGSTSPGGRRPDPLGRSTDRAVARCPERRAARRRTRRQFPPGRGPLCARSRSRRDRGLGADHQQEVRRVAESDLDQAWHDHWQRPDRRSEPGRAPPAPPLPSTNTLRNRQNQVPDPRLIARSRK